jgi:hypothetical protein
VGLHTRELSAEQQQRFTPRILKSLRGNLGEIEGPKGDQPGDSARMAPKDSKDSFALIPAGRVAVDPEGTQGLSRVQQMALARIPTKIEAAVPETGLGPGSAGLIGDAVSRCPVAAARGIGCPWGLTLGLGMQRVGVAIRWT